MRSDNLACCCYFNRIVVWLLTRSFYCTCSGFICYDKRTRTQLRKFSTTRERKKSCEYVNGTSPPFKFYISVPRTRNTGNVHTLTRETGDEITSSSFCNHKKKSQFKHSGNKKKKKRKGDSLNKGDIWRVKNRWSRTSVDAKRAKSQSICKTRLKFKQTHVKCRRISTERNDIKQIHLGFPMGDKPKLLLTHVSGPVMHDIQFRPVGV